MHIPQLFWIYWNPSPIAFTIPFFNIPIFWYGVLFALGFVSGYYIFQYLLAEKLSKKAPPPLCYTLAQELTDKLTLYVLIGTVIGARLGHVLFYDFSRYQNDFWAIFNLRQGGLASHGAAVAIALSLLLFSNRVKKRYSALSFTFTNWLDLIVIPTALAGSFIRLGNFINQELVGIPTTLPWGIVFLSPLGPDEIVARHPVQLYEALAYFLTFGLLLFLFKKDRASSANPTLSKGFLSGVFFICIFGSRFILENFKMLQNASLDESFLSAGQTLSIPFILLGIYMVCQAAFRKALFTKAPQDF